jgi:hypothetical protein
VLPAPAINSSDNGAPFVTKVLEFDGITPELKIDPEFDELASPILFTI